MEVKNIMEQTHISFTSNDHEIYPENTHQRDFKHGFK